MGPFLASFRLAGRPLSHGKKAAAEEGQQDLHLGASTRILRPLAGPIGRFRIIGRPKRRRDTCRPSNASWKVTRSPTNTRLPLARAKNGRHFALFLATFWPAQSSARWPRGSGSVLAVVQIEFAPPRRVAAWLGAAHWHARPGRFFASEQVAELGRRARQEGHELGGD